MKAKIVCTFTNNPNNTNIKHEMKETYKFIMLKDYMKLHTVHSSHFQEMTENLFS